MAGEAEWEALPEIDAAPQVAPAPEAAAEWEALPEVVPEAVREFPEVDLTVDPIVERRNAVIRRAREIARSPQGPEMARAVAISRELNVPVSQVLPNLAQFEYAAQAQAEESDEDFYKKNRELVDVMGGSPEQLATVVTSPTVGPIISALRKVDDWYQRNFGEGFRAFDAMAQAGADAAQKGQTGSQIVESMTTAADTANTEAAQQTEKQRNAKVAMRDTPEAKAIRSTEGIERTLLTVRQRYREGRASTSMGYAGFDVMMVENAPNPDPERVAETAARVQDLRAASTPLYLGETENQRIAGDAIQGLISTADGLLARGAAGAAGAVAGAAAGAVAGAASGRSASAAVAGAKEGAKFGATQGQRIGGAYHGFKAEAGSKYLELRDAVTDDGQKLSNMEAAGGAVAYGLVAGYLETMGFEAQAAPLKNGIKRLLSGDPLFRRRLAQLGAEWLKGAGTEGLTEGLQATASQVFEYVVKSEKDWKLQKGPIASLEDSAREAQVGFLSALAMGGGSTVGALAVDAVTTSKAAMTSPQQVALISQLATDEAMAKAPKEFAEVVRQATAAGGAPVREFWVDAAELQRLNQEAESGGKTEEQLALELNDAAGPDAAQAAKVAVAEGGRFAVPLEQLPKFLNTDLGKALAEHMATSETAPTAAQLKKADSEQLQAIQQHALEMAQKAMEQQADEDGFDDALAQMQRDIVDAGRSAREARDAVRVIRAFYETAKADNPSLTWKGVLEAAGRLEFAEGDNGDSRVRVKAMQPFDDLRSLVDFGGPDGGKLSVPQRAELLYRDDVTGLRTPDGWGLEGVPDGYLVAQVTTPDAKAVNDNPEGSHDSTNELLTRMGAVVGKADPKAARAGTNFWVRVKDQAALDALVAELRAVMPTGMQAFGAAAATREQAGRALDKVVDDARKAGVTVPRGQTAYKGPLTGFAEGVAKVATPLEAVHEAQVDVEGKFESREAFGNQAFRDPEVPGLLTRLGFLKSKPAKFVASLDMRGLRDVNIEAGKRGGDALLTFFGDKLVEMGGHAFAAAHMSGDEYAMKSDSKEALIEMLSDLRDELDGVAVQVEGENITNASKALLERIGATMGLKTKGTLTVDGVAMPFEGRAAFEALLDPLTSGSVDATLVIDAQSLTPARFRFGLGEGTYGKADRDLNTRKQLEAQVADGRGVPEGRAAGEDLLERRSSVEQRRARAQYRGAPAANPFVDVAEGQADELSFDPGGEGGAPGQAGRRVGPHTSVEDAVSRPAGEPLVDAEALAQFRADVGQMRAATKRRARLQAFLAYIEGTAPRPRDPMDGSTVAGLTKADQKDVLEYGIDDPLGTFLSNRQLGLPNNPKRDPTKKKSGWTDKGMQAKQEDENMALQRAAGRKSPLDRLYQSATHTLSDGRTVIIEKPGSGIAEDQSSTVWLINVDGFTQALDGVAARFEQAGKAVDDTSTQRSFDSWREQMRNAFDSSALYLRQGRVSQAVDAALNAVEFEQRLTGNEWTAEKSRVWKAVDDFIDTPGLQASKVEVQTGKFERQTSADAWGKLSEEDRQTVQVALDEFESQTGRLYQQDAAKPAPRTLTDGKTVMMVLPSREQTRVALVDMPRLEAALTATEKQVERIRQELLSNENPDVALWAEGPLTGRLLKQIGRARTELAAGNYLEMRNELDWARATERAFLLNAHPDLKGVDSNWEKLTTSREWFDSMTEPKTMTDARKGEVFAAAMDGIDPRPFALSEEMRQEVLVALDEYESATGRMKQDEANMASTPRGYFLRPPPGAEGVARVMRVFLNKKADASTVMHESAHGFLEMLHNLATTEGAGLRTKQQWADALKWLGVESYAEIKREHHERWARAFEAYLREGKAPKSALFSVFNRFKAWLTRIYKSITQLNVELDENVRRIFDRLLATDEEIMRANGKRGAGPWSTAEEAGMTPEAWQEYQEADAEALAFATREAAARFTRQALDDAEKDWKEQVDAARADAVAEYEALPARKAQRFLEGKAQDLLDAGVSMAPVVLDREAVERAVGATGVRKFRTRKGGANPDETAQMTGFATGPDMLKAITQLPDMSKWVDQRAQALAEERDAAGAAELERLRKEVEGGVQKYVEERMAREWAELGRRAEPGSDVSELGRQVALATLKRAGALIVERQRVGTLSTSKVLARERAASAKVRNAARTGNLDAARDWFREQSLQAYAHGATVEALRERDRFEKMASGLTETAARARLDKASPALRDAVDYLLGAFGLGEPTDFTGETLQAAAAVLEESGGIPGDWFEALQMPELVRVGDWRNLSVANLRHLDAALRQLTAEARFRNEVMLGEKKAEREAVVEQLVTEAREVLPAKTPPGTRSSDTVIDTISSTASALDGFLLNPADLVRDLTGDNLDSAWWRAVVEPIRRAKYAEAEFLQRAVEPVTKALEVMPDSVKARMRDAVDGRRLFPNHIEALVPRQRHELLMMALNVGNEGNLQRLTDGRRITVEEVARALDTLTDDELKWVESVWNAVGALKEDAFALEERETGLRPKGVEAAPFRLPSGRVLKGGYFPAVYDRRASVLGEKQAAEAVAGLLDPRYVRPGTSHGHLKQRVQRVEDAALSLDLSVIYRHLAQVAHDLAFREPVKSVGSLVLDKRVQEVMRERLGDSKTRSFLQWLKDVGGATGATATEADSIVSTARGALSHVLLGWSTATAFGDFANLAASVASTPLKAKHLAAALKDFGGNMTELRRQAMEASPWLRTMADTVRKQFDEQMRTVLDKQLPGPLQWYKDHAFALMEGVSYLTATPVWLGAHRQALAEGRTQEDAVRFADDVLSRVFPSHSPVDQSAILRDRGFWGKATLFYGYLSVAYRAQHRLIMPLFESEFLTAPLGQKAATVGTVAGRLLGFYVAFSVLGELFMGRGPEVGDDDEEEPGNQALRWRNWFMRKLVAGPLSTQPFLPASAAWEAMQTGKIAPSPRAAPASAIAEMLGRQLIDALNGDKPPADRAIAIVKLLLESRGLPVAPLDRQGRWLLNVALGNLPVTGPGDVASGLIYGQRKDQPANIFRPTGTE